MPGHLEWKHGELPRLRGPGWGGKPCEAIDHAVEEFIAQWPAAFVNGIDAWGDPDPHLFTSGYVQEFIAEHKKAIVSRDSIRRRLAKHPGVHKFGRGTRWYKCPVCACQARQSLR